MPPTARGVAPARERRAFVVVALVSLYVLFWPYPAGAGLGPPGSDKLVHLVLFLVLTGTARLSAGPRPVVLAGALAYAGLSEVVQAVALPERSGDLLDLVADSVGVLAGWVLAGRWQQSER